MSINVVPLELHVNSRHLCLIRRKVITEQNRIGCHFFMNRSSIGHFRGLKGHDHKNTRGFLKTFVFQCDIVV